MQIDSLPGRTQLDRLRPGGIDFGFHRASVQRGRHWPGKNCSPNGRLEFTSVHLFIGNHKNQQRISLMTDGSEALGG